MMLHVGALVPQTHQYQCKESQNWQNFYWSRTYASLLFQKLKIKKIWHEFIQPGHGSKINYLKYKQPSFSLCILPVSCTVMEGNLKLFHVSTIDKRNPNTCTLDKTGNHAQRKMTVKGSALTKKWHEHSPWACRDDLLHWCQFGQG